MTLAALKPCPFCGGDKIIVSQTLDQQGPNWYATCHRATCAFTGYSSTKAEAITAWNTRTGQLVPAPSVERVARALDRALAFEVEADALAGETTHEERIKIATAIIAAMKEGWE